jgi:hypothetical protein
VGIQAADGKASTVQVQKNRWLRHIGRGVEPGRHWVAITGSELQGLQASDWWCRQIQQGCASLVKGSGLGHAHGVHRWSARPVDVVNQATRLRVQAARSGR